MIDDLPICLSLLGVAALLVLLITYKVRRRSTTAHQSQPVRIVFKDPFGLATEFNYTLNPNCPKRRSFGNMEFITETGQETPPEHREFELDDGKQGDTLSVTWKLRDGSDVTDATVLPMSSKSTVTVTLTKMRTICFE